MNPIFIVQMLWREVRRFLQQDLPESAFFLRDKSSKTGARKYLRASRFHHERYILVTFAKFYLGSLRHHPFQQGDRMKASSILDPTIVSEIIPCFHTIILGLEGKDEQANRCPTFLPTQDNSKHLAIHPSTRKSGAPSQSDDCSTLLGRRLHPLAQSSFSNGRTLLATQKRHLALR